MFNARSITKALTGMYGTRKDKVITVDTIAPK